MRIIKKEFCIRQTKLEFVLGVLMLRAKNYYIDDNVFCHGYSSGIESICTTIQGITPQQTTKTTK